jgi:glycosyltransferase involved in cell wall biosynthesis
MLRIQLVGSKFLPEYAGAGLRIHNTYLRLARRNAGLGWSVITGSTEFPNHSTYTHEGVSVERIASPIFSGARRTRAVDRLRSAIRSWCEALRLWRRLSTSTFDVLHVFGSNSVTAAAIAWGAFRGTPMVVELVTTEAAPWQTLPGLRIGEWLKRKLHKRTLIIAISAALAERCAREGLIKNVWCRPNPIDSEKFFPDMERLGELRNKHTQFSNSDCVLCMVAKFMPQKNQAFLIDVLEKLPERFKLVLAGPTVTFGPLQSRDHAYIEAIRARIAKLGMSSRVLLVTEFVPADEFIKLADVYMLPNRDEGLATPMLESLACGVPVIANEGEAAFRQWIEPARNGFLCPLDADAWAKAIQEAEKLPRERILSAATAIADVASAETIDRHFLALTRAVATMPSDAELSVADILQSAV